MSKHALAVLVFVLALVLLASAPPLVAQEGSTLPNLEVVIVLDDSNSMWTQTDREDWRADAVELFINGLGVDLSGSNYRLAIVTFDSTARVIGNGFVDLDEPSARAALLEQFRATRSNAGGWTDVQLALQTAAGMFANHAADNKPIVVRLTDGQPEMATANHEMPAALQQYTAAVEQFATTGFQQLTYNGPRCGISLGAPIYTVAIRAAEAVPMYQPQDRALWQRISSQTGGVYYEILPNSTEEFYKELQRTFTDLQREMLCAETEDIDYFPVSQIETRPFQVQGIHEALTFTVSKTNPTIGVTIKNAAGEVVGASGQDLQRYETAYSAASNGLSEAWGFRRPADSAGWAGEWVVELTGPANIDANFEARVSSLYVPEAIALDILVPEGSFLPTGGQLAVEMALTGETEGLSIISVPDLRITCGNGQQFAADAPVIAGNRVRAHIDFAAAAPGECRLITTANIESAAAEHYTIQRLKDVSAVEYPRADILTPLENSQFSAGAPLEVAARLMIGANEYASVGADELIATLYNELDEIVESVNLESDGEQGAATYHALLNKPLPAGHYRLRLNFRARPAGSNEYLPVYVSETRFTIDQPATATPTPVSLAQVEIVSPVAATATPPPPIPVEPAEVSPLLWLLCFVLLGVLGLVALLLLRSRQRGAAVASLVDVSGAGNDQDLKAGRRGRKVHITDVAGERLATFVVRQEPGGGHSFTIAEKADEVEVKLLGVPYEEKQVLTPSHNDEILVGSVLLRYDVETPEDSNVDEDAEPGYTELPS